MTRIPAMGFNFQELHFLRTDDNFLVLLQGILKLSGNIITKHRSDIASLNCLFHEKTV